jgi:hypothetical protein
MTLTPQNVEFGVTDAMEEGYVRDWYDRMNQVLKRSEVFSNSYTLEKNPAVEGIGNIKEGAIMRFNVEADAFRMISINDSYITFTQKVKIKMPAFKSAAEATPAVHYYFIGYEISAAAIKSYRLYSNSVPFLTVPHANFEWKLRYNSFSDEAIENNPSLTNLKKVRDINPLCAGIFVNISGFTEPTTVEYDIPVMIPLSHFSILKDLRWIHDWMGKLRIEITPSYENLVVAPVIDKELLGENSTIVKAMREKNNSTTDTGIPVDFGFYQLTQDMRNRYSYGTSLTTFLDTHKFVCNTQTTSLGYITLNSCKLREAVSLELKEQYRNVPFLFPFQLISNTQFAKEISNIIDTSLTTKLTNVDKIYVFFLENNNTSTMRFVNPFIHYQLLFSGRYYPPETYDTTDDIRHINQTLDALNYNGSNTYSINTDMQTSMQHYTKLVNSDESTYYMWNNGNRANFFIVIPMADTNMFQSGISTGDTQITLKGRRLDGIEVKKYKVEQAYLVHTSDCLLKIRSEIPPGGGSQWEVVFATVDQIAPATFENV